jgi:hypothetical protein
MPGTVTCECGAAYKRTIITLMERDRGDFACMCGRVLESWNATRIPQYRPYRQPVERMTSHRKRIRAWSAKDRRRK